MWPSLIPPTPTPLGSHREENILIMKSEIFINKPDKCVPPSFCVTCARESERYLLSRLRDLRLRWLLPFSLSPLRLRLLRDELRDELLLERLLLLEHTNNKHANLI